MKVSAFGAIKKQNPVTAALAETIDVKTSSRQPVDEVRPHSSKLPKITYRVTAQEKRNLEDLARDLEMTVQDTITAAIAELRKINGLRAS